MRTIVDAAKAAGNLGGDCSRCGCDELRPADGQEVHLSHATEYFRCGALRFYAQFADVVVLAHRTESGPRWRKSTVISVKRISADRAVSGYVSRCSATALCAWRYRAKCYLSLHEMNHSANREPVCRYAAARIRCATRETDVELDIDNRYIMSPKDLKTIHFMNKMLDAGVRVFKIEGRARGPSMCITVVECYKEAIRSLCGRHVYRRKDSCLGRAPENRV